MRIKRPRYTSPSLTFDPSRPRWSQQYHLETFRVALVRKGLGEEFTKACRRLGVKNFAAIEQLVDEFVKRTATTTTTEGVTTNELP